MFDSTPYGKSDLLFKDSTQSLEDVTVDEYTDYLGPDYLGTLKGEPKHFLITTNIVVATSPWSGQGPRF